MSRSPGFEWYVAWRYLGRRDPVRARRWLWGCALLGLLLALAGGLALLAPGLLAGSRLHAAYLGHEEWRRNLQLYGLGGVNLGIALVFLCLLIARFSVFTTISMFGVFLGVATPIVVLSVMSGFETDLKQKILGQHADLVVNAADHAWTGWQRELDHVAHTPGVVAATPYLESEVMIQSPTNNAGIEFRGIDPATIGQVTQLGRNVEVGGLDALEHPERVHLQLPSFGDREEDEARELKIKPVDKAPQAPPPPAPPPTPAPSPKPTPELERPMPARALPGILLGVELARNLRVYPGDDVTIACLACGVGPSGPIPNQKSFRVVGLFKTGMYEFDTKIAYATLPVAQKFLSLAGEITGIEAKTRTLGEAGEVAARLGRELGPAFEVKDWRELNRSLFAALKMEKIAMFIVLAFIILVASFSIVSNLIMVVVEKAREIAILKSMGTANRSVLRIFVLEGLYIGVVGLAAGLAVGLGNCFLLGKLVLGLDPEVYYIAKLPVNIDGAELLAIALCALGISCLATVYPAYLAARMRPIEGLRYE